MNKLHKAAEIAVLDCLAVTNQETVLIITDPPCKKIGLIIYQVTQKIAKEALYLEMTAREFNGEEPPHPVAQIMRQVDVVICPTSRSLTHTTARREACKSGARVGTLPGITEDIMIRTMNADYHKIAELTHRVSDILDKGNSAVLTTALGTHITLPIRGISAISSTGLITHPGNFGNLPSGESYLMPVEGKSEGVYYVDGSIAGIGKIANKPIKITIKDGMAVEIRGGPQAKKFEKMIDRVGPEARNLAELGVGTNYMAKITGNILEDEKVAGTVHLALGNNMSMGGTVNVSFHVDGIITKPTLYIDDVPLIKEGHLRV
jgi:aminopeptidase